jgi:tetratricopeptide (TPR) repeat protein
MAANRRATEIREKIARQHSKVGFFQDVLSQSRENQVFVGRAPTDRSLAGLQESIETRRRLVLEHPEVYRYRQELAMTLNVLGGLAMQARRGAQAEAAFRESIATWRELVRLQPEVPGHRNRLGMALSNCAGLLITLGGFERAAALQKEAAELLERLVREHPSVVEYAISLSATDDMRCTIAREGGDLAPAAEMYDRAIRLLDGVLAPDPRNLKARQFLHTSRYNRALVLLRRGDHRAAVLELDPLTRDRIGRPDQIYNVGCAFSLAAGAAAADAGIPEAERKVLVDRLAARAVGLLEQATAAGFLGPAALLVHMKGDTDLDPLRARGDYRDLVKRIQAKAAQAPPEATGTAPRQTDPPSLPQKRDRPG